MKNQKSAYRFNFIDVLLIVVLIAVLGVIYYFVAGRNSISAGNKLIGEGKSEKLRFVIELKTVDKDYVEKIETDFKNSASVIETVRNTNIGKIVDLKITPSRIITENTETGERTLVEYPAVNESNNTPSDTEKNDESDDSTDETETPIYDFYNVKITVETDASKSDKGFATDSFNISIGTEINFRIPHFVGTGNCISYEVVEK